MLRSPIDSPLRSPIARMDIYQADFTNGSLPGGSTFTRNDAAYVHNSAGLIVPLAANEPKFDYNPTTFEPMGILLEPARNFYMRRSEEFDNGTWWTPTNGTITANQTDAPVSPAGNTAADLFKEDGTTNLHHMSQTLAALSANQTFTVTVWAKPFGAKDRLFIHLIDTTATGNNAGIIFNLSTGAVVTNVQAGTGTAATADATSIAYPDGWRRYRAVIRPTTVANTGVNIRIGCTNNGGTTTSYAGSTSDGVYLWGGNMENNITCYSYIKTLDAAVTTIQDQLTGLFPSNFNSAASTMFLRASMPRFGNTGFPGMWSLDDGGFNNRHTIFFTDASGGRIGGNTTQGGASQSSLVPAITMTANEAVKVALAVAANDSNCAANGTLATLDTSVTLPSGINTSAIGKVSTGGACGGHIRELRYYPTRLGDAELQALTA